jgi:ABC-type antimicrobial peptide transport system permease subunit
MNAISGVVEQVVLLLSHVMTLVMLLEVALDHPALCRAGRCFKTQCMSCKSVAASRSSSVDAGQFYV